MQLSLERRQTFFVARQHGNRVAAFGEKTGQRGVAANGVKISWHLPFREGRRAKPMSDEIEIRLASLVDAPRIAAMSRDLVEMGLGWSWVPSRIARHIRSPESVVLVAQIRGRIVASTIMRFGVDEAHLDLLAVLPKHRRSGVGRKLIAWLEESALVAGVSVVYLEVRAGNKTARAFYESLGYCRVKRVLGYYGGREAAIWMARDLWSSTLTNAT